MKNFFLLGLFLTSCVTLHNYPVKIISDPPGARVEVNNEYIGKTPIDETFERVESRVAHGSFYFRAYPPKGTKGCLQEKYIAPSNPLPSQIYFDTTMCPVAPQQNIDLKVNRP